MKNKIIKPSDLIEFWQIPKGEKIVTELKKSKLYILPNWLMYYKIKDTWYPHRKPTVKEILNNKFN